MPRAFLITHRRYNGAGEEFNGHEGDYSPERGVRLVDYGGVQPPMSDGGSECGSETSSECPEELYNLTKLAEVSLAAAAGTLIHPSAVIYQRRPVSPRRDADDVEAKRKKSGSRVDFADDRTRFYLERIGAEGRDSSSAPGATIPTNPSTTTTTTSSSTSVASARRSASVSPGVVGKPEDSEDHECPDCGKKYSTSSNLARHRQTHRSLGDKKARRCPHCDKIYVSMPAFSMHVRTHNQGCKCHYCGKCFSRPWLLQGHIRTHTGEKPFKCTICNKAFADKSNLRAHIQTHSNTKPHVCGRCGKAFALKSYLYKHEESSCMRAHHRSTSESGKIEQQQSDPKTTTTTTTTTLNSSNGGQTNVTASPTSVIVPPLAASRETTTTFSAIIKHARSSTTTAATTTSTDAREKETTVEQPPTKRPCVEKMAREEVAKEPDYVSRMVIRTSVISPNPERLGRFAGGTPRKPAGGFDFANPARTSAFSRPTSMTLNLAIA